MSTLELFGMVYRALFVPKKVEAKYPKALSLFNEQNAKLEDLVIPKFKAQVVEKLIK